MKSAADKIRAQLEPARALGWQRKTGINGEKETKSSAVVRGGSELHPIKLRR